MSRLSSLAGPAAALVFVAALLGFGLALPGYSQSAHPVAVLGAKGVPHALGFNLLGFVLAGVLAAGPAKDDRRLMRSDPGAALPPQSCSQPVVPPCAAAWLSCR